MSLLARCVYVKMSGQFPLPSLVVLSFLQSFLFKESLFYFCAFIFDDLMNFNIVVYESMGTLPVSKSLKKNVLLCSRKSYLDIDPQGLINRLDFFPLKQQNVGKIKFCQVLCRFLTALCSRVQCYGILGAHCLSTPHHFLWLLVFLPLLLLCSLSLGWGDTDVPLLVKHLIVLILIPCLDISLIISCIPWNTEKTNALFPKKEDDTAEIVGTKQLLRQYPMMDEEWFQGQSNIPTDLNRFLLTFWPL